MIPETGHFLLVLSLVLSALLGFLPLWGLRRGDGAMMAAARPLAMGLLPLIAASFACLTAAFLSDDFSVGIVATQSNSLLPWYFKFSAVWGGHEGSLLLWILILTIWTFAVALFSRGIPGDVLAIVLAVMGLIAFGFISFALFTSNPFDRLLPVSPPEGEDLNPLLQDAGMVIHPPMLYFGYVGFSVAYSFAIAALVTGRMDAAWARWARPWTNAAWGFLTAGITLGSWWAYYELGWGGWWFWDPVENASFMPWLAGTALVHSLAVTEKRGAFKSWTVLLAIFAFSLSLLGTFLVRSGVLTSVHSFAADPGRGLFILAFLGIVTVGSLALFAFRAGSVQKVSSFSLSSRDALLVGNNVLLFVATLMVLIGTLFPLVADFAGWGKYSVGAPYFNLFFSLLMIPLALILGFAGVSRWKRTRRDRLIKLWPAAAAAVLAAAFLLLAFAEFKPGAMLGLAVGLWVIFSVVAGVLDMRRNAPDWGRARSRMQPAWIGMQMAHTGFALCLIGVCLTSQFSSEQDIRMEVGQREGLPDGSELVFDDVRAVQGPNYEARRGDFTLFVGDDETGVRLSPEKRRYFARSSQIMTEAAIDVGLFRDVYIAMGEELTENAWSVRIHYKPFVRWIWWGAALMALGGVFSLTDARYRRAPARSLADVR